MGGGGGGNMGLDGRFNGGLGILLQGEGGSGFCSVIAASGGGGGGGGGGSFFWANDVIEKRHATPITSAVEAFVLILFFI